jgi:hypothetical protein
VKTDYKLILSQDWIAGTFLISKSFIEMINDMDLSFKCIAVSIVSIPGDKSGDPQNDTVDDDLLLMLSLLLLLLKKVGFLLIGV